MNGSESQNGTTKEISIEEFNEEIEKSKKIINSIVVPVEVVPEKVVPAEKVPVEVVPEEIIP